MLLDANGQVEIEELLLELWWYPLTAASGVAAAAQISGSRKTGATVRLQGGQDARRF